MDIRAHIKRFQQLLAQQSTAASVWQELGTYILPHKSDILVKRTPGSKKTEKLFDGTAIQANKLLASSMQGSLTSAAVKWFRLKMRDDALNNDTEVAMWLDLAADRIYLALQQSNFNAENHEGYLDLGAFGTSAMLIEERDPSEPVFSGLRFTTLQIGGYVIAENALGLADTLYRTLELPAVAVLGRWGEEAAGPKIVEWAQKEPDRLIKILHCVFPRGTYGVTAKQKPWGSLYILTEGADQRILGEGGYDEFPYMVPRWEKSSGEVYGTGPGHTALPDIKTLNKAIELTLRAWNKALDPPLEVLDDGVIGSVKLTPAGLNTVRQMGAIKPIEFGARFDINQVNVAELRMAIRDTFYNNQLQLPSNQPMTATEVERRWELMQRLLGPTLGRLESELLNPLIQRVFGLLMRRGVIPPPPDIVIQAMQAGEGDIDIEYEGPLARAQRSSDVQAAERTVAQLLPLVEVKPDILDNLDLDGMARWMARRNGMPAQFVSDPRQIARVRQERAAQAAEEQQKMDMERMAQSAGRAAPVLKAMYPQGLPKEMLAGQGDPAEAEAALPV